MTAPEPRHLSELIAAEDLERARYEDALGDDLPDPLPGEAT